MPPSDPMLIGAVVYIVAMVVLFTVLFFLDRRAARLDDQLRPPQPKRLAIEARKPPLRGAPEDGRRSLASSGGP